MMPNGNTPARPVRLRRRLAVLVHNMVAMLVGLVCLLRASIYDEIPYLATLTYAMPPAVLFGLSVLMFFLARRLRWVRVKAVWTIAAGLAAAWWAVSSVQWNAPDIADRQVEVLFWNVGRGYGGWDNIVETIRSYDADLVALVEAGNATPEHRAFFREAFEDYHVSMLGGGFVLLSRGEVGEAVPGQFSIGGEYRRVPVPVGNKSLELVIVDIVSRPLQPRKQPLAELTELAGRLHESPLLIVGDFNTPVDSHHLLALRRAHRNIFEECGRGYGHSWPLPLPVLTLDQMWVNSAVHPLSCYYGWTLHSDHRPLAARVSL